VVDPTPVVKRGQHYCVEVPDGKVLGLKADGRLDEDIPYDTDVIASVMDGPRHVKLGVFEGVQVGPTLTVTVDTMKWMQVTSTMRPIGFVNASTTPVTTPVLLPSPPVKKRPAEEAAAVVVAKRSALAVFWDVCGISVAHFCDADNLRRVVERGGGAFRGGLIGTREDDMLLNWTRDDMMPIRFPVIRFTPPGCLTAILRRYEAVPRPDPPKKGQWAYRNNETGDYDPYQDEQASLLEAAFGSTPLLRAALDRYDSVLVELESMTGDAYVVDLGKMEQRNTATEFTRPVRRTEVDDTGNVPHARREAGKCVSCGGNPEGAMVIHDEAECFCELELCASCAAAGDCTRCNRPISSLVHRHTGVEISIRKDLPVCDVCCRPCPNVAPFPCLFTQADKDAALQRAGSIALKALEEEAARKDALAAKELAEQMKVGALKHPNYMVCEECVKAVGGKCPECGVVVS
jgi:hypothetical protein